MYTKRNYTPEACNFNKKETPTNIFTKKGLRHRCFLVKFAILQNNYFEENLRTTGSEILQK